MGGSPIFGPGQGGTGPQFPGVGTGGPGGGEPNIPVFVQPTSQPTVIVQRDPLVAFALALIFAIIDKLNELIGKHNGLFDSVIAMAAVQKAASRSVWSILKATLHDALHLHFVKALHDLQDLVDKIRSWKDKLQKWIDRYKRLRKAHDDAVRRLLNMMQRIRKILVPFRLLHLKFASKLDGWLAGIEGRIISREHQIFGKTNEIISWINLITDPRGALRGVPVFQGLGRMADAFLGALDAVGVGNVYPARRRISGPPIPARPFADWQAPFFKTAASSPSYIEQFSDVVDAYYKRVKEEIGT